MLLAFQERVLYICTPIPTQTNLIEWRGTEKDITGTPQSYLLAHNPKCYISFSQ